MLNKRGQGLSTGAIVLIILAVLVLVVIVLAFFLGADRLNPFINKSNNIKELQDQCTFACNTDDRFGYCNSVRELKLDDGETLGDLSDGESYTCEQLYAADDSVFSECAKITCAPTEDTNTSS